MPASLNAYFEPLRDQLSAKSHEIASLRRTVDTLSTVIATITSQVSELQHRLDVQEARLEAQIGTRKQRKPKSAPLGGN